MPQRQKLLLQRRRSTKRVFRSRSVDLTRSRRGVGLFDVKQRKRLQRCYVYNTVCSNYAIVMFTIVIVTFTILFVVITPMIILLLNYSIMQPARMDNPPFVEMLLISLKIM